MAEVKRLNYFTAQALVEQDFDDEQAYHLNSNRQHNRLLHAGGVAEGLDVTLVSGKQIQVSAGMAIDNGGREIVLGDALTYSLATPGTDRDVFLTIAYQEVLDPADKDTQGLNKVLRTTERPLLQDGTATPSPKCWP